MTQENANTSTAPQDELTAAPSGAPEGEGDKIEPSKQKTAINRPKTAVCRIKRVSERSYSGADFDVPLYLLRGKSKSRDKILKIAMDISGHSIIMILGFESSPKILKNGEIK